MWRYFLVLNHLVKHPQVFPCQMQKIKTMDIVEYLLLDANAECRPTSSKDQLGNEGQRTGTSQVESSLAIF